MRGSEKTYLMNMARDIVVSKLSNAAPGVSNKDSGKAISDMYESIYNKLSEIYFSDNIDASQH